MKKSIILIAMMLFSSPAYAGFYCEGNVKFLGVNADGLVNVNNGYGVWKVCSLSVNYGSVTPQSCAGWYSGILTAKSSAKTVRIYFEPSQNSGKATCQDIGDWVMPVSYFIDFP